MYETAYTVPISSLDMAPTVRKRTGPRNPARTTILLNPDPARMEGEELCPPSPILSLSAPLVKEMPYRFVAGDEQLHADAVRASGTRSPLLIMGEPGTGKSALARFIHEQSRRPGGRFLEFHCDGTPEALLTAQLFGSTQGRPGDTNVGEPGAIWDARGGTLLISGFEMGARALRAGLLPWLESRGERTSRAGANSQGDVRLILAADQDIRSHVDRTLWQRLVAWPPILLAPLRVQRKKKWSLFGTFIDHQAAEGGWEPPLTVDFLLYAFVVSYGWPGNTRQLCAFARYLVGSGALQNRHLSLDQDFCFFDSSEAFAQDDALEAERIAQGVMLVFRNRAHRDFARALRALQSPESGRSWLDLSKASPDRSGRWSYPKIRWSDPYFSGADTCARVGQAYDAALAGLKQWNDRVPARELVYRPDELPWVVTSPSQRVAPGWSRTQLADLVAYGLVTGEISDKDELLAQVYEAVIRLAPDLTPRQYQKLGIPKARLAQRVSRRRATT